MCKHLHRGCQTYQHKTDCLTLDSSLFANVNATTEAIAVSFAFLLPNSSPSELIVNFSLTSPEQRARTVKGGDTGCYVSSR